MGDFSFRFTISCEFCGKQNPPGTLFCTNCGKALSTSVVHDFYGQLAAFQRALIASFDMGELRGLSFELGILDFASLPGETKEDKARELILRMVREDRLPQLVTLCQRERPGTDWPIAMPKSDWPQANPLDDLFRAGIRHQLAGNLTDALQVFNGIERIDPNYPGLAARLADVKTELGNPYVNRAGIVDPLRVLHSPVIMPRSESRGSSRGLQPWVWLLILLALLAIGYMLIYSQFGQ